MATVTTANALRRFAWDAADSIVRISAWEQQRSGQSAEPGCGVVFAMDE